MKSIHMTAIIFQKNRVVILKNTAQTTRFTMMDFASARRNIWPNTNSRRLQTKDALNFRKDRQKSAWSAIAPTDLF